MEGAVYGWRCHRIRDPYRIIRVRQTPERPIPSDRVDNCESVPLHLAGRRGVGRVHVVVDQVADGYVKHPGHPLDLGDCRLARPVLPIAEAVMRKSTDLLKRGDGVFTTIFDECPDFFEESVGGHR
jgi:hypothetical protein